MMYRALNVGVKMSDLSEINQPIWQYAIDLYRQEGVESDFLIAQNQYGLDVPVLIFALYCSNIGRGFHAPQCVELARKWAQDVVNPLRAARIALKTPPQDVNFAEAQTLRAKVKAAELESERLVLIALDGLPCEPSILSASLALCAIVNASCVIVDDDLASLLNRLATAAENMTRIDTGI
jgi:uncharacterized protein (TIGR02444 family)